MDAGNLTETQMIAAVDSGRLDGGVVSAEVTETVQTDPVQDVAGRLVSAGATEAEAETLAPIVEYVLTGEEISGNQADTIAKNDAAVSVLESAVFRSKRRYKLEVRLWII